MASSSPLLAVCKVCGVKHAPASSSSMTTSTWLNFTAVSSSIDPLTEGASRSGKMLLFWGATRKKCITQIPMVDHRLQHLVLSIGHDVVDVCHEFALGGKGLWRCRDQELHARDVIRQDGLDIGKLINFLLIFILTVLRLTRY